MVTINTYTTTSSDGIKSIVAVKTMAYSLGFYTDLLVVAEATGHRDDKDPDGCILLSGKEHDPL